MQTWIAIAIAYATVLDTLLVILWVCGVGTLLPRGSEEKNLKIYGREFIEALRGIRHCLDCQQIVKAWWAWCVYLICSIVLMCANAVELMDSTIGWHRTDLGLTRRKDTEALFKCFPRSVKAVMVPIAHWIGRLLVDAPLYWLESMGPPLRHAPAKSMLLLLNMVILVQEVCKMLKQRQMKADYIAQTVVEHLHLVDEFMLVLPSLFYVQSALAIMAVMQMRHVLYARKSDSNASSLKDAIQNSEARELDHEQQRGRDIVWIRDASEVEAEAKLYEYAQLGDIEGVNHLLDQGTNAAAVDQSRQSALHAVALQKDLRDVHVEIAERLLTRSLAPRDGYGKSALHYAAQRGSTQHIKIIQMLQGRGLHQGDLFFKDKDGFNPLMLAARTAWRSRGNQVAVNLIKEWLAQGPIPVETLMQESYIGAGTLLIYLVALGDEALVCAMLQGLSARDQSMIVNQNAGMGTALFVSLIIAEDGDQKMPLLLLELGADPRKESNGDVLFSALPGVTPLMLAIWRGFDDVVDRMLKYVPPDGWPPAERTDALNASSRLPPSIRIPPPNGLLEDVSSGGYSAASLALLENNLDLFMSLLPRTSTMVLETRIDQPREGEESLKGMTLLLLAVHVQNKDCAQALLERGVSVEAVGPDGKCALVLVIEAGLAIDWVKMLTTSQAGVNVRHPNGKSALEFAMECGRYDVMTELIDAGADKSPSHLRSVDRKAFLCKRIGISVDLMFLVDTTYSMAAMLSSLSSQLRDICGTSVQSLKQTLPDFRGDVLVRVHVIGYRDSSDANSFTNYTTGFVNVSEPSLASAFEQLKVGGRGGGDECEDMPGALLRALQSADWKGDQREIIVFTDAPCHGSEFYHGASFEDDDPGASQRSRENFREAFKLAIESDVNLQLCTCSGTRTDKMFDEMMHLLRELRANESRLTKVPVIDDPSPCRNRLGLPEHIIFCLDESGSMYGDPWNNLCESFNSFWTATSRADGAEWSTVSVVQFSDTARVTEQGLPLRGQPPSLQQQTGGTSFMPAMQEVERLAWQAGKHLRQVLIFMSDGDTNDGDAAIAKSAELVRVGLLSEVFTIGFTSGASRSVLGRMASSPDKHLTALTGHALTESFALISKEMSADASTKVVAAISDKLANKLTAAVRRVELEQSKKQFSGRRFDRSDSLRLLEADDLEGDLDA